MALSNAGMDGLRQKKIGFKIDAVIAQQFCQHQRLRSFRELEPRTGTFFLVKLM